MSGGELTSADLSRTLEALPHQPPMRLVDVLVALVPGESARAKAEASRQRMQQQWQRWRLQGGRKAPVARQVPEAYRSWVCAVRKVDLAELAWLLAEEIISVRGSSGSQAELDAQAAALLLEYGSTWLTSEAAKDHFGAVTL